jgi:hypothetical protein
MGNEKTSGSGNYLKATLIVFVFFAIWTLVFFRGFGCNSENINVSERSSESSIVAVHERGEKLIYLECLSDPDKNTELLLCDMIVYKNDPYKDSKWYENTGNKTGVFYKKNCFSEKKNGLEECIGTLEVANVDVLLRITDGHNVVAYLDGGELGL